MATIPICRNIRKNGFTLIELLVVIAIIGILISLSLPTFGRFKRMAETRKCASNLKQIGIAVQQYIADHNGMGPPLNALHYRLRDYIPEGDVGGAAVGSSVWLCPSEFKQTTTVWSVTGPVNYSYSFNPEPLGIRYHLNKQAQWNPTFIRWPSKTVFAGDTGQSGIEEPNTDFRYDGFVNQNSEAFQDYRFSFRHNVKLSDEIKTKVFSQLDYLNFDGKCNFLFHDGHVEALKPAQSVRYGNAAPGGFTPEGLVAWQSDDWIELDKDD